MDWKSIVLGMVLMLIIVAYLLGWLSTLYADIQLFISWFNFLHIFTH